MSLAKGKGHWQFDNQNVEYALIQHDPDTPSKQLLILLHEGLGCVALWKNFPQLLSEKAGCDVFCYSRLGYGGSAPCDLPRNVGYMHFEAQQVLPRLIEELAYTEIILIGHSDGASIAAIYAGTRLSTSLGLTGLVLIAPHFFTEQKSIHAIAEAKIAYDQGELRERLKRYHGDNVDVAFRGWNDGWLQPQFMHWNIESLIPFIHVPVQLIQGEEDQYGTLTQLERFQRQAKTEVFANTLQYCMHSPHGEKPDETIQIISDFLDSLVSTKTKAKPLTAFIKLAEDRYPLPAYPHRLGSGTTPDHASLHPVSSLNLDTVLSENWQSCVPYRYGWYLYLHGFYWEAHEIWENVWLKCPANSREKKLLQTLIQMANAELKRKQSQYKAFNKIIEQVQSLIAETFPCSEPFQSANDGNNNDRIMGINASELHNLINDHRFSNPP